MVNKTYWVQIARPMRAGEEKKAPFEFYHLEYALQSRGTYVQSSIMSLDWWVDLKRNIGGGVSEITVRWPLNVDWNRDPSIKSVRSVADFQALVGIFKNNGFLSASSILSNWPGAAGVGPKIESPVISGSLGRITAIPALILPSIYCSEPLVAREPLGVEGPTVSMVDLVNHPAHRLSPIITITTKKITPKWTWTKE